MTRAKLDDEKAMKEASFWHEQTSLCERRLQEVWRSPLLLLLWPCSSIFVCACIRTAVCPVPSSSVLTASCGANVQVKAEAYM